MQHSLYPQGTQWSYDPNTKQMMASGVIANSSIYGNLRTQGACNLAVNVFRLNEGYYPSGVTITLPTNEGCKWVKIISDEGCGDSVYVCFETLDKPIIANTLVINTQCDSATGLVRINMVGGNDNFTYQWTPTGAGTLNATGNQLSDLTAGIYIVKVTDKQTGCSIYDTLVVKNINSPLVVEAAVTPENCTAKDGAIVLTPSNYTYTWLDGFVGNTRNNISAGTYYIHVTNGDDCDNYITVEVGRTNGDLVIDAIVIRKPDCKEANGEVMVIVNGGTNPITITWSDGGTGSSRNNLSSGTYTITAVDANGCTAIKTIVVEDSSATNVDITITNIANETCTGSNNGSVTFTVTPLVPTRIVNQNGDVVNGTNLAPGVYCIEALEDSCLVGSECFEILPAPQFDVIIDIISDTCGLGNGAIYVDVIGGMAPYTYDWLDIAGTNNVKDRVNLTAGTYTLIVTDSKGCSITTPIDVANIIKPNGCDEEPCKEIENAIIVNSKCGETSGSITVNMVGGNAGFNFAWTPSIGTIVNNRISNLPAGIYYVTITNGTNNCVVVDSFAVGNSDGPDTTSTIIIPATCKLANGSVTLLPPTNTYTWNDGFVGNVRNNLVAGNYLIAIDAIDTDCRNFIEVVVNATAGDLDASYVVNQLPSTCDATNGIVTINVVNGVNPIKYTWNDGFVFNGGSTHTRSNLGVGNY
ncbi:MAG: hypothetical protein IPI52_16665 [Bacteroidetes bacterium]|nr:hypothetical protein [Bacteroidota bacterium]